ncbi:hypothetical protein Sste5344_000590 [Sporothrix stenoceras]
MPMTSSSMTSTESVPTRPNSVLRAFQSQVMSPTSDIVGPSPVTSNGTETTEIEDDEPSEPGREHNHFQPQVGNSTPEPQSLNDVRALGIMGSNQNESNGQHYHTHPGPPPISTDVKPVRYSIEASTPQAQNLDDVLGDASRLRASSVGGLEDIPEHRETELQNEGSQYDDYVTSPHLDVDGEGEIGALRAALEECWTLCNTLANLSSIHRERVFNSSGTPDAHEMAWKCCWKLCQRLYHSRDEASDGFSVRTNLDLCRDFCQALFDVRQRQDEVGDSILRVSFELNNHLYSAQGSRALPEPFKERTLDFYITLCHRLMKQRSELAEETDSLLRACWSLAEMLFSLRQNSRDGKAPDEELLGSAVQACWELCDIFREGWTQIRPDRGTPRPSQITFQQSYISDTGSVHSGTTRVSSLSKRDSYQGLQDRPNSVASMTSTRKSRQSHPPPVPETPVTEFEDTPISPQSSSPVMPNIMVLGTNGDNGPVSSNGRGHGSTNGNGPRWPSSASNLSGYSQGSNKTSSTATTATSAEDINIVRIKMLILKAAMNIGFNRDSATSDGAGGTKSLQTFVKNLPTGSFGSLPIHATLLQSYKSLVLADNSFRTTNSLPTHGRRVTASDAAKSVGWMILRSNQYGFLRDLFRLVFSFPLEEADSRKNSSISV